MKTKQFSLLPPQLQLSVFCFLLCFLLSLSSAFGGGQKIKSEFNKDDWWAQRATVFFPKYQFTLQSTVLGLTSIDAGPRISKNPKANSPDAITATDYTHNTNSASWGVTTDWSPTAPAGGPNGIGDIVRYGSATTITTTQDTVGGVTVGSIILQGSSNNSWTITNSTGITLNSGTGTSLIENTDTNTGATGRLVINGGTMTLGEDLLIRNTGGNTAAATNGSIAIGSVIAGSGNITFNNVSNNVASGPIRLTGTNTFVGSVLIQKGAVTFSTVAAFGNSGNIITLGESGQGGASLASTAGVTVANNIVAAAGTGGTLTLGGTSTGSSGYSGTITLNGDLSLTSATTGTNTITFSNAISGAGSITKIGTGAVTFSGGGNNNYAGTTSVTGGTLILGKTSSATVHAVAGDITIGDGATTAGLDILRLAGSGGDQIADTSILTFNGTGSDAGTFQLNGKDETIGGLVSTGGAGIVESTTLGIAQTLTLDVNTTNRDFSGIIRDGDAGSVSVIKTGSATQTLSGANTYTGATSVNGGSLFVNGSTASGSAVTVTGSGTVLGGTGGTVNGSVSVGSGAILQGGTGSTGQTLTLTGAVTMASGSIIQLALGPSAHSTIAISGAGTLSFATNQDFKFIDLGATATTYNGLITGVPDPGVALNSWVIDNGYTGSFSWDSANGGEIDITLTAVPEPSTWIGGALAVGVVGWSFTRKKLKTETLKS